LNSAYELLKVYYNAKSYRRAWSVSTDYSWFDNGKIILSEEVDIYQNERNKFDVVNKIKTVIISLINERKKYYGRFLKKVLDFFNDESNIETICHIGYTAIIQLNDKITIKIRRYDDGSSSYMITLIDHTHYKEWSNQLGKYCSKSEVRFI